MEGDRKLKILFVSMHYTPEPCDTRTSTLARDLAAAGHRCTALTSFPNYPFGRIYDGWRQRPFHRERQHGVDVIRVPMFPDHSKNAKRRALSYASFMASATLIGGLLIGRPDMVWIHHPPLTTGIAGAFLAMVRRVPYVYEIHDVWPDTLVSTGMIREGRIARAIQRVCDALHRRAARIVVTSEGMRRRLIRQGTDSTKIEVIPQWADESVYQPLRRDPAFGEKHGLGGGFNVVFAGNLGLAQGLDTVLDAAKRCADLPDVRFLLIGDGCERTRLEARCRDEGIANVRLLGHHPAHEMPRLYAWADGLLVHLRRDPLFEDTVPSKTQVYLASARPVLCGVMGDATTVVEEAGAGLTFASEDAEAMASAVRALRAMEPSEREALGANARAAYVGSFARAANIERYERIFRQVVEHRPSLRKALARALRLA